MTLVFVLLSLGLIWVNLVGLGLLAGYVTKDYAVARVGGALALCLVFLCLEHFVGMGPRLWFFPVSTALSAWLIVRERRTLSMEWDVEAAFGVGFLYCAAWRYMYPQIDLVGEKIPDLEFINDYMTGVRLPAPDMWFPPFSVDFYYSFQFYGAGLLGRWFCLEPGVCYQLAFCVMSGLITCAIYAAARRLCPWRPGGWVIMGALLVGGCGLGIAIHMILNQYYDPLAMVRFLGTGKEPSQLTQFGKALVPHLNWPGAQLVELPVSPLGELIAEGEYHPPLAGMLVLAFSLLIIATLSTEGIPRRRALLHALLAATVTLSIMGDTWVFPLQLALVLSWFVYRAIAGERGHWLPGLGGLVVSAALAYPFLANFLRHPAAHSGSLSLVTGELHATPTAWLAVFWPMACLLVLSFWNRERRGLCLFFACSLVLLLVGTEMFYLQDTYTGTLARFNSCLKWWGWVYAAGIIGLGALNLASRSRICRYGSLVAILLPAAQVYDFTRQFLFSDKDQVGLIDGSGWFASDPTMKGIITTLRSRPAGICIDSSNIYENSEATVTSVFAGKASYVGWPTQEGIWRDFQEEINTRVGQEADFYAGKMADPLQWLLSNNVRYVLWLQKDNDHANERFLPLDAKIRSHYAWRLYAGNGDNWAVGFWERIDSPIEH
jgi:uncharacterized membrane protein